MPIIRSYRKFINAKQAGDIYAYRNVKRKLHKAVAAIWFKIKHAETSSSSDGKPEAATAVVVAPDDGHEGARNMLSSI
jgi:hypothetical protein